ncbi:uncharacterized protein E0L32_007149 [Thyridium curvatum]|uniref:Calcineurin-like phosphoesterase domain-containing protein n=1 Tax=Thyridium curvatum TaxID=1093900 RepID=A0A507AX28_9PEZI|nr:uncharacterized protein E0L32_007149 [Thyridium curvatum]TPX12263.1 hypothetical protein E0L32_007149 [Thyridium curvatum]
MRILTYLYPRHRRRRITLLLFSSISFIVVYVFYTNGGDIPMPTQGLRPAIFPTADGSSSSSGDGGGGSGIIKLDDSSAAALALQRPLTPMSYGTAARPPFKGLDNLVADLPAEHVPGLGGGAPRRLVIVGDVHGMRPALDALLAKVGFDRRRGDHLVLAGDMVSKGPDTPGVVALAMELGASAVRGNHEDRVLLARAALDAQLVPGTEGADPDAAAAAPVSKEKRGLLSSLFGGGGDDARRRAQDQAAWEEKAAKAEAQGERWQQVKDSDARARAGGPDRMEENPFSHGDAADRETAASLSPQQVQWLASLPVVLRVGRVPGSALNRVLVVHAGLVPGIDPEAQDPWAAMNMRSLVYPGDDERRQQIREELEKKAKQRAHGISALTARVTDKQVEAELRRLKAAAAASQQQQGGNSSVQEVALPVDGHSGEPWHEAWNRHQLSLPPAERTTVVYGHDARRGLAVDEKALPYTFGLDSGCSRGNQLSALVIEAAGGDGGAVTHKVVQVKCDKAAE